MHARDYTQSRKLIWIWRRKIYIFMQCAQNEYVFFRYARQPRKTTI